MIILLAITLVASVAADVKHLFAHSDSLQDDGYHYHKPSGVVVLDIPAASEPDPSYQAAASYQVSSSHNFAASVPVTSDSYSSTNQAASAKDANGYYYQVPQIPFESRPFASYSRTSSHHAVSAPAVPYVAASVLVDASPSETYDGGDSIPKASFTYKASHQVDSHPAVSHLAPASFGGASVSTASYSSSDIKLDSSDSRRDTSYQKSASEPVPAAKVASGYHYQVPQIPFESPPAPVKEYHQSPESVSKLSPPEAPPKSPSLPKRLPPPPTLPPPPKEYLPPTPINKPAPPVRSPAHPKPTTTRRPPSPTKEYFPPPQINKQSPLARPPTTPARSPPKEYTQPSFGPKGYSYPNDPQPPFNS